MSVSKFTKANTGIGCIILFGISLLALLCNSLTVYIVLAILWMVAVIVLAKTSQMINKSKKENQWLFLITLFGGTGYYLKAARFTYEAITEYEFLRLSLAIMAYFFIFMIFEITILYLGCIFFKGQEKITIKNQKEGL